MKNQDIVKYTDLYFYLLINDLIVKFFNIIL